MREAEMATELDIEMLEEVDKTLKKQEKTRYFTKMSQIYRRERKQEREYLIAKSKELQGVLLAMKHRRLDSPSALPWKIVADVLDEEKKHATCRRKTLKAQVDLYECVVREMAKWVMRNTHPHPSLNSRVQTWRDHSLLANPISRRLGKEWILKQMHHNADRIFQEYGCPSNGDNFISFDVVIPEKEDARYVWVAQMDCPFSVDHVEATYCRNLCPILNLNLQYPYPDNTVAEEDGSILLHRMTAATGEVMDLLTTSFREGNRLLVVAQEILTDEILDERNSVRNKSYWMEVFQLPSGQWKRRSVWIVSQQRGYPLAHEARTWGFELQDNVEESFRRGMKAAWARLWPNYHSVVAKP
ncbi:hypothetical protein Ae201684P_012878 [Aphanomyces euteiches]|uniref:Uncharacterized protein n=1 Tax=Aphanomyces euteiches TaxID=100861 RepID=A0A6G0XG13_9STRA|nr:hypothetical protein Ae201684_005097 [Aphanomyces euteiches]KAH9080738.1 hypothetical protein Ae201684P_012878 [Aphanomyces euteiches]KAH9143820.1 hypothetical protein AeRB84_012208 [Aphanomyces euteiches]